MKRFIAVLAFAFSNAAGAAQTAIDLRPMTGDKTVDIVESKNFTGSCGKSIVRVMGVTQVVGDFYSIDLDAGRIIVRADGGKELVLTTDNGALSDHNGVSCVQSKAGMRLLVWNNCSGSACGDNFSFVVIDPERLTFLSPKDPQKTSCDAKCASKILGNNLPHKINGG